jgi:hypothetical protein
MPESVLTHTVPAVLAGGGELGFVLADEELDLLEPLDEFEAAGVLEGVGVAVGVGFDAGAGFKLAVGVDAGVAADSVESLFFERLFFLVVPESADEVSAA